MKLNPLFLFLALGFALAACSPAEPDTGRGPEIQQQFNREGKIIQVQVFTYPTHADVTRAKARFNRKKAASVFGWAAWSPTEPGQCAVHVRKATRYMDKEFETWGHELAHCLYGSYHKELD